MESKIHLVKNTDTYKLVINKNLEYKIRHMCSNVHKDEWSGILFYKYTGSFNSTIEFEALDFILMDIGYSTYTEFDSSPEIINYMIENNLLDSVIGLIHSHNNMATFFSGTDLNTLKEKGNEHNHFLSLIVNNEGKYTAAITKKLTVKTTYNTDNNIISFNNEKIEIKKQTSSSIDSIIEYSMLDIIMPEIDLDEKIASILKEKESKKAKVIYTPNNNKKEELVDLSLFGDYNKLPLESNLINEEDITILAFRILTGEWEGEITSQYMHKVLPTLHDRFKKVFETFEDFELWIDDQLDMAVWNANEYIKGMPVETAGYLLSEALIQEFKTYEETEYINYIIRSLKTYL